MKLADAVEYISKNCPEVEVFNFLDGEDVFMWNVAGYGVEHEHAHLRLAIIGYAEAHQELVKEEQSLAEQQERREYERLKAKYG